MFTFSLGWFQSCKRRWLPRRQRWVKPAPANTRVAKGWHTAQSKTSSTCTFDSIKIYPSDATDSVEGGPTLCVCVRVRLCSVLPRRWGDFNRIGGVSSPLLLASSLFMAPYCHHSIFILKMGEQQFTIWKKKNNFLQLKEEKHLIPILLSSLTLWYYDIISHDFFGSIWLQSQPVLYQCDCPCYPCYPCYPDSSSGMIRILGPTIRS